MITKHFVAVTLGFGEALTLQVPRLFHRKRTLSVLPVMVIAVNPMAVISKRGQIRWSYHRKAAVCCPPLNHIQAIISAWQCSLPNSGISAGTILTQLLWCRHRRKLLWRPFSNGWVYTKPIVSQGSEITSVSLALNPSFKTTIHPLKLIRLVTSPCIQQTHVGDGLPYASFSNKNIHESMKRHQSTQRISAVQHEGVPGRIFTHAGDGGVPFPAYVWEAQYTPGGQHPHRWNKNHATTFLLVLRFLLYICHLIICQLEEREHAPALPASHLFHPEFPTHWVDR